jgi:hypothetical protein
LQSSKSYEAVAGSGTARPPGEFTLRLRGRLLPVGHPCIRDRSAAMGELALDPAVLDDVGRRRLINGGDTEECGHDLSQYRARMPSLR